jgi:hypothetical protein
MYTLKSHKFFYIGSAPARNQPKTHSTVTTHDIDEMEKFSHDIDQDIDITTYSSMSESESP